MEMYGFYVYYFNCLRYSLEDIVPIHNGEPLCTKVSLHPICHFAGGSPARFR